MRLGGVALLGGVSLLASCSTQPDDPGAPVGSAGSAAQVPGPVGPTPMLEGPRQSQCAAGESNKPGYRMLRRLSQAEYNRTLASAFGIAENAWQTIEFPGEIRQRGVYDSYSDALSVNEAIESALLEKTATRSDELLADGTKLVPPCVVGSIDAACASAMVRHYGYRLFRRPVTETEVSDYTTLFSRGTAELALSAEQALSGVVAALMHSPYTLYIEQLGAPEGSQFRLGPYEVASVLAYGLSGGAPSPALLDRAGMGALGSAEGTLAVARELQQSAAGQAHVARFFGAWLSYDAVKFTTKDPAMYQLTPELGQAMADEQRLLVDAAYRAGAGLSDLLLSPTSFINLPLAQHYGWPTDGLSAQLVEKPRPAGQGLGILAQGAFLTRAGTSNSSSPTQRGVFVLSTLGCLQLGQPPPVVPEIVPPSGEVTTRERYETVHGVAGCSACHGRFDPIGFGLENFDGIGRYRTQEVGKPIDASGSIADFGGVAFNGPEELARVLAAQPELHQCFAGNVASYVYGVSVADGQCIAPAGSYSATTDVSLNGVVEQVATAAHLALRAP
jgi:hypothetical protein